MLDLRYSTSAICDNCWSGFAVAEQVLCEPPAGTPGVAQNVKVHGHIRRHEVGTRVRIVGQGEILVTPLQLCNAYAAIANRGWYITPHVVKKVIDTMIDKKVNRFNIYICSPD